MLRVYSAASKYMGDDQFEITVLLSAADSYGFKGNSSRTSYVQLEHCPVEVAGVVRKNDYSGYRGGAIVHPVRMPSLAMYQVKIHCGNKSAEAVLSFTNDQPVELLCDLPNPRPPSMAIHLKRVWPLEIPCLPSMELVLHQPELSDVRVVCGLEDARPILHTRLALVHASPWFKKLFSAPCSKSEHLQKDGSLYMPKWSRLGFLFCSIHIYTGWLPTFPLPETEEIDQCLEEHGRDPEEPLTSMELVRIVELARLLEMPLLEKHANAAASYQLLEDSTWLPSHDNTSKCSHLSGEE